MVTKQNVIDMIRSGKVRGFLPPEFNSYDIKITEMGTYTGLTLLNLKDDEGLKAMPVFNLDNAMNVLKNEDSQEAAAEKLAVMMENFIKNVPGMNVGIDYIKHIFSSYENAKPYIYMDAAPVEYFNEQAIIYEKNGMKFVPKVLINNSPERVVAPIPAAWLKSIGISQDELINYAIYNTEKLMPADITSMQSVAEKFLHEDLDEPGELNDMYIVSNKNKTHGAALILNQSVLDKLYNTYNSDFFVLPSSIHEVITIPVNGIYSPTADNLNSLMEMVAAVNDTLNTEEILGYEVSIYNGKSCNLEKATEYCINKNIDKIRSQRMDELRMIEKNNPDENPKM